MTGRPSFTSLADYVEGRLDPDAAASIEEQLAAGDPEAAAIVEWLRTFLSVAEQLPLEAPPVRVRYYLRRQFDQQAARGGVARQLLATLRFDSRRDLAAAGVRSATVDTGTVHLAFRCDAGDVLLDLAATSDGGLRLDGQVLWAAGLDAPILEARLTGPDFAENTTDGDDLGRFSFARVPADVSQLMLHAPDVDIRLTWEPYAAP